MKGTTEKKEHEKEGIWGEGGGSSAEHKSVGSRPIKGVFGKKGKHEPREKKRLTSPKQRSSKRERGRRVIEQPAWGLRCEKNTELGNAKNTRTREE